MKKKIFITVALIAFTSITNQLFAQEATSKTIGKTMAEDDWQQNTSSKSTGEHIKNGIIKCRVLQTETGCSLAFEYDVKSPKDVATGQSSGKRGYDYYKAKTSSFSVSALDNSTTEVKSPRDVATGQSSGKRMHKPMTVSKEYDKGSPMLAKKTSSSNASSSEIAIDEPGVQKVSMQDLSFSKVNVQDISFTKRCGGKTTKISCDSGECEIPIGDCPNGDCAITADWSWGMSQSGTISSGSGAKGMSRCSIDFFLKIEDGVCTAMAINEKGLPGEKKPNKTTTNNPK